MASAEPAPPPEHTKPLEEKVADLKIGEKAGAATDAVHEHVEGATEAVKTSANDAAGKVHEAVKKDPEEAKSSEKPSQSADSREVDIAEKEADKSPDKDAYVVPAVDHRAVQEPEGEGKVDVPTAVVHEKVDSAEKPDADSTGAPPDQQGKGIVHSITKSVKSALGIGKGTKNAEGKEGASTE